jgi:hypothetical protein
MLNMRAEPYEPVYSDAHKEIEAHAPIELGTLVAKDNGQMRGEREVIDRIAEKDGNQIFEPPSGSSSEILLGHGQCHRERGGT